MHWTAKQQLTDEGGNPKGEPKKDKDYNYSLSGHKGFDKYCHWKRTEDEIEDKMVKSADHRSGDGSKFNYNEDKAQKN